MNNKNYRVMKFFEPVNKKDKSKGYVRLDMRGNRGNLIVAAENLGDAKSTSEVYLYKDRHNKIKLGDINNKKGIMKKMLTFGSANAIEDYNVCAVVKNGKIVLYSNLFSTSSPDIVRKLEEGDLVSDLEDSFILNEEAEEAKQAKLAEELVKPKLTKEVKEIKEVKDDREVPEPKEIIEAKGREVRTIRSTKEMTTPKLAEEIQEEIQEEIEKADESIKRVKIPLKKEEMIEEAEEKEEPVVEQKYRNRYDEKLYKTLNGYKEVEPLSVKIKNFKWWYIPYDEMGMRNGILPYYNQIISSYYPYPMSNRVTTCASLMKKYGHYVFGLYRENDEITKFIYGVPGEFTKEEQPYKGATGFKNWSYASKDNKKENGYWLAFVNPKTGETTEPPQISLI